MKNNEIIVAVNDFVRGLAAQNGEDWEKLDPVQKLKFNVAAGKIEVILMEAFGEPDKKLAISDADLEFWEHTH